MDFTFPTLALGVPTSPRSVTQSPKEAPAVSAPATVVSPAQIPLTARSTVVDRSAGASATAAKAAASTAAAREVPASRAPIVRQKESDWGTKAIYRLLSRFIPIALEKGYSQVDWLRLTRNDPHLNGLSGAPLRKDLTLAEVRKHNTEHDAWMVLRGKVYNISPYLRFHPGGVDILLKAAGRDGTALFNKYHPWVNGDALLEKCLVGWIAQPPAVGVSPAAPAAAPPPPPILHTESEGEEEGPTAAAAAVETPAAEDATSTASAFSQPHAVSSHVQESSQQQQQMASAKSADRAFVAAAKVSTAAPSVENDVAADSQAGALSSAAGSDAVGTASLAEPTGDSSETASGQVAADGSQAESESGEQRRVLGQPRLSSGSLAVAACLS